MLESTRSKPLLERHSEKLSGWDAALRSKLQWLPPGPPTSFPGQGEVGSMREMFLGKDGVGSWSCLALSGK